jgi:hypothetical protein
VNIIESTQSYEAWLSDQTDLQNKGLDKKHKQMAFGAFPFLRSTFYRWVQRSRKECSDLHERDQDVLLAVGDLHVENFGIWRDSRERLVWGVNDFDEACQLPFTIDLVRLATSIILAAEAVKIEAPMDKVTEFLITGYEDGLKAGGRPILLEEEDYHELLAFVCTVKEDPAVFWARKLDDNENPEIGAKELPSWLEDIFGSAFPPGGKLVYRREKRPGGLGSLGRRRYIAVLKKGRDQYIAREAKALVPSALSWLQKRPAAKSLTATLFQRAVRSPDPWVQVHDRWLVRQLAPDAVKIELPSSQEDSRLVFAPDLIRAMGFESANIHLGSKSPSDLQTAMDRLRRDLGGDWLITATGRMAKVTRQDHMEWKKHWNAHWGARKNGSYGPQKC